MLPRSGSTVPSARMAAGRASWPSALALAAAIVALLAPASPARALTPGPADRIGHWDPPFAEGSHVDARCSRGGARAACGPTAAAMAAMPDGRIFYFSGVEADRDLRLETKGRATAYRQSAARVLDMRSGLFRWTVPGTTGGRGPEPAEPAGGEELFCADLVQLPDGRILLAGGSNRSEEVPALVDPGGALHPTTRILGPDGSFRPAGQMNHPRWYPGLVMLPGGEVLMAGGTSRLPGSSRAGQVDGTETYDPTTNAWTENVTGAISTASLPPNPRLFLMPNGKILYLGSGESIGPGHEAADEALWGLQRFFDPKTGEWEIIGPSPGGFRDGATSVTLPLDPPYDKATVLTFGGMMGTGAGGGMGVQLSTLTTVDRSGRVTNEVTGSTSFPRWFSSAVPLPDGTVLALAGAGSTAAWPGAELPLREVELYVPGLPGVPPASWAQGPGQWFRMASPQRNRTYHNSAVLLPDGRVLLGGHAPRGRGVPGSGQPDASFEIFSPHYLYRGRRPTIQHAPAGIRWEETFRITTPQALGIQSVVLMRLASPQHVNDSDVRTLRLAFARENGTTLRVAAPPDGHVAPPGLYYLFLNKETPEGPVPSVARIVRVSPTSDPTEAIQPIPDGPLASHPVD
jgi:hypothetical protein